MMTSNGLDVLSPDCTLSGTLDIERSRRTCQPRLVVRFHCPACRSKHVALWPTEAVATLDATPWVDLPESCRLAGRTVLVELDPDGRRRDRDTLEWFKRTDRAWRVEAELSGRLLPAPHYSIGPAETPTPMAWI